MKKTIVLTLALIILGAANMKSQVTIGSQKDSESFSLLELISSSGADSKGLRLPQMSTADRNAMTATAKFVSETAGLTKGLVIYNTDTDCMEFWNGTVWISLCDPPTVTDPRTLPQGSATLSGRRCFDVAETVCENTPTDSPNRPKTDFSLRTVRNSIVDAPYTGIQRYVFRAVGGAVSNIRYLISVTGGDLLAGDLIDETETPLQGVIRENELSSNLAVNFDIRYKADLNTKLKGKNRLDASKLLLTIYYFDGAKDVKVEAKISMQDCNCCGVYYANGTTAANDFRVYMCHNLGADESLNPFIPNQGLHGNFYKWGVATPALTATQNINISGTVSGWSSIVPPSGNVEWDMTTANPCPPGFRIPTTPEQQRITTQHNAEERQGSWVSGVTNWDSGIFFGKTLFLPAAGSRNFQNGQLTSRGSYASYWNSSLSNDSGRHLSCATSITHNVNDRNQGYSVRCIEE